MLFLKITCSMTWCMHDESSRVFIINYKFGGKNPDLKLSEKSAGESEED